MGSTPSSRAVKVGSPADADADALLLGVGIKEPAQQVWRLSWDTLAAASSQAAGTSVQSRPPSICVPNDSVRSRPPPCRRGRTS